MTTVVLDASALLAVLNSEPGAENLTAELLSTAVCSTLNLAEVHGKLLIRGLNEKDAWTAALLAINEAVEFTADHARIAGNLIVHTRTLGLSLGDRACLALAIDLGVPVYTADRSWKKLSLPISVHAIR